MTSPRHRHRHSSSFGESGDLACRKLFPALYDLSLPLLDKNRPFAWKAVLRREILPFEHFREYRMRRSGGRVSGPLVIPLIRRERFGVTGWMAGKEFHADRP